MSDRICSFGGCGRPHKGHGLCDSHLRQAKRGSTLSPIRGKLPNGQRESDLRRIATAPPTDECVFVEWGATAERPTLAINGETVVGAVYVLTLASGEQPAGRYCLHDPSTCSAGRCLNPRHLYWGTQAENMADKYIAGTEQTGERHNLAKLTEADVLYIRRSSETGVALAARFGITKSNVSCIRTRKTWKHI